MEGSSQTVELQCFVSTAVNGLLCTQCRGGVGTPYSGLYGEAPLTVYKRVGKIAILVYQRVTKSAAKWKKWWLKRNISKGATFWQK